MISNNNTTINLQALIGVDEDEIKKELDSVKYYARLYDFNYREILDVYSEDFVPACMYANIDRDTMHNLFIAIMEFLRSSRVTDNIAKETMQELSHAIASKEEENPGKYLESSRYRIPNLEKHINYIYQNGNYYDKTVFCREFEHHIHDLYKDKTEGAKNKYVTKRKNAENEIFYGRRKKNFLTISLISLVAPGTNFLKTE